MAESRDGAGGGLLRPRDRSDAPGGVQQGALLKERGTSTEGTRAPQVDLRKSLVPELSETVAEPAHPGPDEKSIRETLNTLRREVGTLLELVFPELSAAALYRDPPAAPALAHRIAQIKAALTEADGDGGVRFPGREVKIARARYDTLCVGLPTGRDELHAEAVMRLRMQQQERFRGGVPVHASPPGSKTLYGTDVLKIEHAARELGIGAEEAHEIARTAGYSLLTTEKFAWVACDALPNRPATIAAVAQVLLAESEEGARALQRGAVSAWLNANRSRDLAAEVERHEALARRAGQETLARHQAAWSLGVREVCWLARSIASPEALGRQWGSGEIDDRTVVMLAQSGVLSAWFGTLDERVLQARANAVAENGSDRVALDQLRWSIGIPWVVGGESFTDVRAFADRVRAFPPIIDPVLRAVRDGTFGAWLESLPAGRGDPTWREVLRDPEFARHGTHCGFWVGIFRNARDVALHLTSGNAAESVVSWRVFLQTTFSARFWDSLKPLRASGELVAFLLNAPTDPVALAALPSYDPHEPIDASLNTLLWSLGAQGMVIEWGGLDQPVQVPEDLARLYEEDPLRFEEELAKGYPLTWLQRRVGPDPLWGPALAAVRRLMLGKVPSGHAAAAVVLCARRGGPMPVYPTRPGGWTGHRTDRCRESSGT